MNNTKDFAKLKKLWYQKLKKEGFEDIEKDEDTLKHWATRVFKERSNGSYYNEKEVYYQSREEYYRLAGRFFYDHTFENDFERLVWEQHMTGISVRDLTKLLNKGKKNKLSVTGVQQVIKRLSNLMLQANGIKT